MIDSESPFTRVQTNFLPVQPVYKEPCKLFYILKLFAVQNFTRFREYRVRKRKANPCKILSVQKLFLDSSKRVLKAIFTELNNIILLSNVLIMDPHTSVCGSRVCFSLLIVVSLNWFLTYQQLQISIPQPHPGESLHLTIICNTNNQNISLEQRTTIISVLQRPL